MRGRLLPTLVAAAALAAGGQAALAAGGLVPRGWTHAEINYVAGGAPHTLVLDRGRVVAVSPSSLTLREQDGNPVQIALAATTRVVVRGRPGQVSDIRRGVVAVTERIDGGAATLVRVQGGRLRRR